MESLGHYLLRGPLALPEGGATEVYEGQDVRTGIEVLAFRPCSGEPPRLAFAQALPWIDHLEQAWIAEVPVGAVQASWLVGQVEPVRLAQWVKQLVGLLEQARAQDIPIGRIIPELIWVRGSRAWLGGVGVEVPEQRWDFSGLLQAIRAIAKETYPTLPWREVLEGYLTGQVGHAQLLEQLEAFIAAPEAEVAPTAQESAPTEPSSAASPPPNKSLKVEQEEPPPPPPPPPRRIRIEERLEPPFEVLEPPQTSRRALLFWLWLVPLFLLLGGVGLWWRYRPPPSPRATGYPVVFRLEPSAARASLAVLEAPEGSAMPLGVELAELPGEVTFDRPGIYRIRVRVPGRAPVDALIEVPNPGGVTIQLR
ncbi:hypothetical protein [Meiothermus rufus]|uniref:hypothetical protein n=1 Tax=Meiothermus rufus TaxID=604332 RepID=UPI000485A101|nr:hypothetical protein [Meiothermus rufus]